MSHEHRLALEKIVVLCQKSRLPTKRTERIMDIALEALGHTANQRELLIREMREGALQKQRNAISERRIKETLNEKAKN